MKPLPQWGQRSPRQKLHKIHEVSGSESSASDLPVGRYHRSGPLVSPLPLQKQKTLKLGKQAQGTLGKVLEMIETDQYCPEIIQQVDSVLGLLKTAKRELLAGHLDTCLAHQMKTNKKKAIDELLKIYNLSC